MHAVLRFEIRIVLAIALSGGLVGCAAMDDRPSTHNERTMLAEITPHAELVYPRVAPEYPRGVQAALRKEAHVSSVSFPIRAQAVVADQEFSRFASIRSDHRKFYTESDLRFAALGVALAATIAHTDVDEDFRNWWQADVHSDAWDDFSDFAKPLGDGYISLAIMGAGMVAGSLADDTRWGRGANEWGSRSLRAVAVGAPALLLLQAATGAGRPGENSAESDWLPFQDSNGVSGHAFMGAVPFIAAAQMTENPLLSGLWYTGSLMSGVSRISDDDHYLSQVILGWWLAKMACDAVDKTERQEKDMKLVPLMGSGGTVGVGVQLQR